MTNSGGKPSGAASGPIAHIGLQDVPEPHPVAHLANWWNSHATEERTPPWSAFDPVDHRLVLPWILLLRPMEDGRLKYVVSGTLCDEVFGFSYLGKVFGEGLPPDAAKARKDEFNRAVTNREPLYSKVNLPVENKEFIKVIRGVFPFLTDSGDIERIMVVIAPVDRY